MSPRARIDAWKNWSAVSSHCDAASSARPLTRSRSSQARRARLLAPRYIDARARLTRRALSLPLNVTIETTAALSVALERSSPAARAAALRTTLLAMALALVAPSCDNPACVFGGTCNPDDIAGGANPPTTPANHTWLRDGAPTVTSAFPSGPNASLESPLALIFSESMAGSTLGQGALELVSDDSPVPIPVAASSLIGDGRVWVGAAGLALQASTEYRLRVAENRTPTDLQGAALLLSEERVLGTFTTAASSPITPRVLATYPADNATGQSATGELVVIFDRPMNPLTVNLLSFRVLVNGVAPTNNPTLSALQIAGAAQDTRVWRYRTLDAQLAPVALPNSAAIDVQLSTSGAAIQPAVGTTSLPQTVFEYTTAPFGAPRVAQITSLPADAIGADNLDGSSPLEIALDLTGAVVGDTLRIYVFGRTRDAEPKPLLLARSATLTASLLDEQLQIATIGEAQIDLASATAPVTVRLAEEQFQIAFALQRGTVSSPVRLMDVDDQASGVQGPVLDVTPPQLLALGGSGQVTATFTTDQRDFTLVGRANESIRACEVSIAGLGDNGLTPRTAVANVQGLFVAKPVAAGLIDPALYPLAVQAWIFDRALNRSVASIQTAARQVGAIGPGQAVPGAPQVAVEVRDAQTLVPVVGARVITHEDQAGTVALVAFTTTDSNGLATLNVSALGEALVTVEATGYDLVTVHGVRSSRVSLLVSPTTGSTTVLAGALTSSISTVASLDGFAADTRLSDGAERTIDIAPCTPVGTTQTCAFGPSPIQVGVLGAVTAFAVDTPATAFNFSAQSFMRGFAMQSPLAPAASGAAATASLTLTRLLDDPAVGAEERALGGPPTQLDASTLTGVQLTLADGEPRVSLQSTTPGLPGPVTVGLGVALDATGTPNDLWELRSAFPGDADPTSGKYPGDEVGALYERGSLTGDLYLRAELRDQLGARSVLRTPVAAVAGVIVPPDAANVLAPTLGSTTAGASYDVVFSDCLPNGGDPGLFRVTLVGANARRWVIWRLDGNLGTHSAHVPAIAVAGGAPLPPGAVAVSVRAYAYPTFDSSAFLFADLELRARTISDSAPVVFAQP